MSKALIAASDVGIGLDDATPPGPGDEAVPVYEVLALADCAATTEPAWVFEAARCLLSQPVDQAICEILETVGRQTRSDRAWMLEYDDDMLRFCNLHEWSQRGVISHVQDLQDTPVTMIGWLHQFLIAGQAVMINQVERLPRAARTLQVEMLRQGDRSVLSVPVFHEGRLRGCIGTDAVRSTLRWSKAEILGLFRCAELIALARYGARRGGEPGGATRPPLAPLIYLRHGSGLRGVDPGSIVCLCAARNSTEIWLADKTLVLDRRPLGFWSAMLPKAGFVRIHRTTLANLLHVQDIFRDEGGRWRLRMRHLSRVLPVSRSFRQELFMRIGL